MITLGMCSYRVVVVSDSYQFSLPVSVFTLLVQPTELTVQLCRGLVAGSGRIDFV
jgi:hypothetical protein